MIIDNVKNNQTYSSEYPLNGQSSPQLGNRLSTNLNNSYNDISEKNWAFIDMQNLYKGVKESGWTINFQSFRMYLRDFFNVSNAVAFLGYIQEYQSLYNRLKKSGFSLEFRPVKRLKSGLIDGGNVDADLSSYAMDYKTEYDKAIIVADDGDYYRTIQSLKRQNKLKVIISSHPIEHTSELIRQVGGNDQLVSIHSIRNIVGYAD